MLEYLSIDPLNKKAMEDSKEHWDNIAKPIDGLGLLEDIIVKIAGIQGTKDISIKKKAIVVMCSDNGVVAEKVTQTDQQVTAIVTENFAKGTASVNQMAAFSGAKIIPVDMGISTEYSRKGTLDRRIANGTNNIAIGPAMSLEQAEQGILAGIQIVKDLKDEGYQLIGTGEMGIGNTTTSSAIASVLLNLPPEKVTGRGAGLSKEGLLRKTETIKRAILVNDPNPLLPIELISKLGGFDIAGLTGLFLGGGIYKIPMVIDGFISSIAALLAVNIKNEAKNYMLASHMGKEPASSYVMDKLGLSPIIHGHLALGEGTGTTLLFPMLEIALRVYEQNNTFEDIHIEPYENFNT